MTQNGFVRITSQPSYPSPITPGEAVTRLEEATRTRHHEFWPCDIAVVDGERIDRERVHGPRQVTDGYLLALAAARTGRFVTFDRSLPVSAVRGATEANLVVL